MVVVKLELLLLSMLRHHRIFCYVFCFCHYFTLSYELASLHCLVCLTLTPSRLVFNFALVFSFPRILMASLKAGASTPAIFFKNTSDYRVTAAPLQKPLVTGGRTALRAPSPNAGDGSNIVSGADGNADGISGACAFVVVANLKDY